MVEMLKFENRFEMKFGGDDTGIDAVLFSRTIANFNNLLGIAANNADPESVKKLRLEQTKPGCFSAEFICFTELANGALALAAAAGSLKAAVDNVVEFLDFIPKLGKKRPKLIEVSGNDAVVITGDGNNVTINRNVHNLYMTPSAQQAVLDIMHDIANSGRDDLSFKTETTETSIKPEYGNELTDDIFDPENGGIEQKLVRDMILPIVKLDLLKSSPWILEYGKKSTPMKVSDDAFMERVHSREIKFSAGDALDCVMEMQYKTDDNKNLIKGSDKYRIIKVNDVIRPNKNELDFG